MGKAFYTKRYTADFSGIINFWRNRILRICPLYYFAVLILSLFVYTEVLKVENWGYLIRILTFTYNQALPINFNAVLWSLSTELQFYLIVPFLYIFIKNRLINSRQILLATLAIVCGCFCLRYAIWIAIASQKTLPINEPDYFVEYIYTPLITNLDSFLCGLLVNGLLISQKDKRNFLHLPNKRYANLIKKTLAALLMSVLYLFTAYYKYYHQLQLLFIGPLLAALLTSIFIFIFESDRYYEDCCNNQKLSVYACLRNPLRAVEIFGNLSYGLYIWHFPIVVNITPIFTSNNPLQAFLLRFVVTMMLSTLLSAVTYYLIEIPVARLKSYRNS